jgi:hypothetical protein
MSKFKHAALALGAASLMAVQAQASEPPSTQVQAQSVSAFSHAEIAALFESSGPSMQLAALSPQEMKETEGAWLNLAIGGAIGLGSYAYSNWGNMTWGGALGSTALGAVGGYGAGVAGLRVLGPYANGGAGVAIGRAGITNPSNWYGNASQIVRFDAHRNSSTNFVHVHHRFTPNAGFTRHQPISSLWRR